MAHTRPGPPKLLEQNKAWAPNNHNPDLVADPQNPKNLWIGCSDSRVPETTICNCKLGDIFTHRNIANLVHPTDDSVLSVVEYAVGVVKVENVIIVGHTKCGGAKAAWKFSREANPPPESPVTRWLAPLVALSKELGLNNEADESKAVPKLIEENVKRQVSNVVKTAPVQKAWASGQKVSVHGWVFHLENSIIEDLNITIGGPGAA